MPPSTNPGQDDGRAKERKLWALALVFVGLGAVAAGAFLFKGPTEAKLAALGPLAARQMLPPPSVRIPGLDKSLPPSDRLPRAKEDELSFGDLLSILGAASEKPEVKPLARDFSKSFMAEPRTRRALEEFKKSDARGERPRAKVFMDLMRRTPEFKAMTSRFASQPGASSALMAIANSDPQLKRFLLEQKQLLKGAGPGGTGEAAGGRRAAVAASGLRRETSSAAAGDRSTLATGLGGPEAARAGAGGGEQRGYSASDPLGGPRNAGPAGDGRAGPSGGGESRDAGQGRAPKEDKKEITPVNCTELNRSSDPRCRIQTEIGGVIVGTRDDEEMDTKLKEWLARFGLDADRMMASMDQGFGLWGSCFALGKLAACHVACEPGNLPRGLKTLTQLQCGKPERYDSKDGKFPYYAACIEWKGQAAEVECLKLCKDEPLCANPPDVIAKHCGLPKDYKRNSATCTHIRAPNALEAYCGTTKLCQENAPACAAAELTLAAKTCPVKPDASSPGQACAALHPDRTPPFAQDCMTLEVGGAGSFCKDLGLAAGSPECRQRWVAEHNKELDDSNVQKFTKLSREAQKPCLDAAGGDWRKAALEYDRTDGKCAPSPPAAGGPSPAPAESNAPAESGKVQPGCDPAWSATDGTCWDQEGSDPAELDKWRATLSEQGVEPDKLDDAARRLYVEERNKQLREAQAPPGDGTGHVPQ